MIVADDALYTKRRPPDLLYISLLLKSIDEPPEVKRIQNVRTMIRMIYMILETLVINTLVFIFLHLAKRDTQFNFFFDYRKFSTVDGMRLYILFLII